MIKYILFDMDGTLFDLYGVENWLTKLRAEDESPYLDAKPMWDMEQLIRVLMMLKELDWGMGIGSWLAKESSAEYKCRVRQAKRQILLQHFRTLDFFDEIHLVAYGTPKTRLCRQRGILVDDNAEVRAQWERNGGITIDPLSTDLVQKLYELVAMG